MLHGQIQIYAQVSGVEEQAAGVNRAVSVLFALMDFTRVKLLCYMYTHARMCIDAA